MASAPKFGAEAFFVIIACLNFIGKNRNASFMPVNSVFVCGINTKKYTSFRFSG